MAIERLFHATDASSLGLFRLLFGVLVVLEYSRRFVFNVGRPALQDYFESQIAFKFPFFEQVPVPEGVWLRLAAWTIVASAFFLALGRAYRIASILLWVSITWQLLWDAAYYSHHTFLLSLLGLCFGVTDAHRFARVSVMLLVSREADHEPERLQKAGPQRYYTERGLQNTTRVWAIPYWHYCLFRIVLLAPYLLSALGKLNSEWLSGHPLRTWFHSSSAFGNAGAVALSWVILIFELGFPFLVSRPRTRLAANFAAVLYHVLAAPAITGNRQISWVQLAALLLFFETGVVRRYIVTCLFYRCPADVVPQLTYLVMPFIDEHEWREMQAHPQAPPRPVWVGRNNPPVKRVAAFLIVFTTVVAVLPVLQFLHSTVSAQPPSWDKPHQFTWRVPSHKNCTGEFIVVNTLTQKSFVADAYYDPLTLRAPHKDLRFKVPWFTRQYAEFIGRWYAGHWACDPKDVAVYGRVTCSLSGRPPQAFVDESVNLAALGRPNCITGEPFVLPLV